MNQTEDTASSPAKTTDLEELRLSAIRRAFDSQRLEDIEKAVNISKLLAEREKSAVDVKAQAAAVRLEQLKSWAALLVPFLTLVTLAVTVGMQYAQLAATREANADLKWRENVKMVLEQINRPSPAGKSKAGSPGAILGPDPLLAATLLKSYIGDIRYGKEAVDLSLLLLSRLPSDVFLDLFSSLKINVTWDNLDRIIAVNRNLSSKFNAFDSDLSLVKKDLQNLKDRSRKSESFLKELKDKEHQLTDIRDACLEELTFISEKIAEVLKTPWPAKKGFTLDLSRVYIRQTDLSGLDLTDSNLKSARFEMVKLSETLLKGIKPKQFDQSVWVDSNWWDAKEISPDLLKYLLANYYPYHGEYEEYTNEPPPEEEYAKKIRRLCELAGVEFPTKLEYGRPEQQDEAV